MDDDAKAVAGEFVRALRDYLDAPRNPHTSADLTTAHRKLSARVRNALPNRFVFEVGCYLARFAHWPDSEAEQRSFNRIGRAVLNEMERALVDGRSSLKMPKRPAVPARQYKED